MSIKELSNLKSIGRRCASLVCLTRTYLYSELDDFMGLSFSTISSAGPNAGSYHSIMRFDCNPWWPSYNSLFPGSK